MSHTSTTTSSTTHVAVRPGERQTAPRPPGRPAPALAVTGPRDGLRGREDEEVLR